MVETGYSFYGENQTWPTLTKEGTEDSNTMINGISRGLSFGFLREQMPPSCSRNGNKMVFPA